VSGSLLESDHSTTRESPPFSPPDRLTSYERASCHGLSAQIGPSGGQDGIPGHDPL